jgi:uncharacterized protein YcbK (DUF882 family)
MIGAALVIMGVLLDPSLLPKASDQPEPPSKKASWLDDKGARKNIHRVAAPVALPPTPVVTLHNVWTDESLPLLLPATPSAPASDKADKFDALTRCHYTNQSTRMNPRLLDVVIRAARRFHARYIEIVSGFRAPKYQLMLRKKGHEVARDSQHPRGQAVDFRIPDVATKVLLRFIKSLHVGGVGYYPESRFVHCDVGPVRFWRGH